MPQPLAFLNDEEMHWLNDLGLPNQRRWLNHRTLGDDHRRTFPSAARDISIISHKKAQKAQKKIFKDLALYLRFLCLFVAKTFCGYPRVSLPAPPCSFSRLLRTLSNRSSICAHSELRGGGGRS